MSFLPDVKLTGSADKVIWVYGAFIALIALVGIYFLGRSTGVKQSITPVVAEPVVKNNLTYSNTQYIGWADEIEQALSTFFGFGANYETVRSIFSQLRTNDDVKQLVAAFGERRREFVFHNETLNLWITGNLSSSEVGQLNRVLSNNNITYQF